VANSKDRDSVGCGTEVYYTGDRANREGFGTITAETAPTKYAPIIYTITMRDGRTLRVPAPYIAAHYPAHGARFVLASAYREWQRGQRSLLLGAK
jgi:hypothetical protein